MGAECWSAGTSCGDYGVEVYGAEVRGTQVKGGGVHAGCNITTFQLVYEPRTSPLRVHVCGKSPPPMECPAMVIDEATWDITPLLAANEATRAVVAQGKK
jgi:hypothetical protein